MKKKLELFRKLQFPNKSIILFVVIFFTYNKNIINTHYLITLKKEKT